MFPARTQASKDTPREERRRVPSYDESIQGHPNKKEGKERKEKREREREGKEKEETGVPSYEQTSRDTPGRGVNLSIAFRNTPTGEGGKDGVGGERGTKLSAGSNEPQKYFDRCGHLVPCQRGWLLGPLRSRKGISQLGTQDVRQKSEFSRPGPPTLAASCSGPGRRDRTNPRCTSPREALCGLIPGWHEAIIELRTDVNAVPHASLRTPNPEKAGGGA